MSEISDRISKEETSSFCHFVLIKVESYLFHKLFRKTYELGIVLNIQNYNLVKYNLNKFTC